jgi:DNA-binding NtrC family response regulator
MSRPSATFIELLAVALLLRCLEARPVRRQQILIVAQSEGLATSLFSWLGAAGYEVAIVTTVAAAKLHLDAHPELVIAEVKLGEYNGLHVALHARALGIAALVLGHPDAVLERDAQEFGVSYRHLPVRRPELLRFVTDSVQPAPDREQTRPATTSNLLWTPAFVLRNTAFRGGPRKHMPLN